MSAAHMSQTLPPQSMTAPSQLSESNQLQDSLSSQLSSVQNPSSMSSTVSDPTQSMTLSHEQSQPPQEQSQPAPAKPSQINVNAPPFQSMNYMRQQQQQSYMQQTPQAQIVTSQQLEFTDQSMQQSETQYYSQPPTLQDTQSAHEAQMSVQSAEPHAPGSYPHQHPGMGQPGGYQRPTSAGRGNGRGGRGSRGAGGSTYRGSSRPPFNTRNGGYSYHQPRDYQSNYVPQDRGQYGAGAFSQSGYKRGGGSGAPPRGGVPRGRGTAPRGGNNRGRGGFAKPNQTPVTA
ncbi:caprin-1-like isoform X3 [Ptychodera flava]|uniref:caprin-1-like isoform X3 n=1 Tax=Ptychodera flava TaxID=63121 RepID=UPI003969DC8F